MPTITREARSRFHIEFDNSRLMERCLAQVKFLLKHEKMQGRSPWPEGRTELVERFTNAVQRALRTSKHFIRLNLSECEANILHDFIWFMESCQDEVPDSVQVMVLNDKTEEWMLSAHWAETLFSLREQMSAKDWR